MITGMPGESSVRGDVHAEFGGRAGETDQPRGWHRAPARPYAFRFNRRSSRVRGLLFYRLLELAVAAPPRTYHSLLANPGQKKRTTPKAPVSRAVPRSLVAISPPRPWRQPASAATPQVS
jgi:hypothetical protein